MEWDRLISDYFDDALAPGETEKMFRWIDSHPDNAKRFAQAAFLHRCLEQQLTAKRLLEEPSGVTDSHESVPNAYDFPANHPGTSVSNFLPGFVKVRSFFTWRQLGAIAALVFLTGMLAFMVWPSRSAARLVAAENAEWGSGITPPKMGDRMPHGNLVLNSGRIKFSFDNGNQVTIEGPAHFAITDTLALKLDQGTLAATATRSGRGLQVLTSLACVTDLGTEFVVQASVASTRVVVFNGKVVVVPISSGANSRELTEGSAVDVSAAGVSPVPFDASAFASLVPSDLRALDLIDLLAGGNGTGSASGAGINAATGEVDETNAVTVRRGDHQYTRIKDSLVLDGCFIPDGQMPVDSAGHLFTFPATSLLSYGLIWAGPDVPWEGTLPIATTLPGEAAGPASSRVLVMHSNNGITLNLDAIRALHAHATLSSFRARVGNSYRATASNPTPTEPRASIHVLVDGLARFEKLSFANVDAPIDVFCSLSDNDHFLTLATTDGGDGNSCDWVLWTHPELMIREPAH